MLLGTPSRWLRAGPPQSPQQTRPRCYHPDMSNTIETLREVVARHLATDDIVRGQREDFAENLWLRYLPGVVSDQLDIAAVPSDTTRQDLFDQAQEVGDAAGALALYLRIAGWGANRPQPVWRCARPFTDPRLGEVLLASRDHLREAGPVEAYWWMLPGGNHHVHGLGPAFFSKWLYFCGYPARADDVDPQALYPLILDARVAQALGLRSIGSKDAYATYLDAAHTLARDLDTTPHCIEHALFTAGRN